MFEWLDQEIEAVKTRRFHVVDGPADASLRLAIDGSNEALPRSYQEFALRFGNAKLYKELGYYIVGVRATPVEEQSKVGEELYRIGQYQSSNTYFKGSTLHGEGEAPVFEEGKGRLFNVAEEEMQSGAGEVQQAGVSGGSGRTRTNYLRGTGHCRGEAVVHLHDGGRQRGWEYLLRGA